MSDTAHRAGRRIVLIGGLVALAIAVVVAGTRPSPAILGSNGVRPEAFVAVVPADRTVCQSGQVLPATTASLTMTIGTYGRAGSPVQVGLRDAEGALLARGRLRPGWQQGRISVPLDRTIARDVASARLCLTNRGRRDIAVAGSVTERRFAARVGRRAAAGRISALYVSGRRPSHFARVEPIVHAMANGPGLWGQVAPWAALALAAAALTGVVRTLW